MTEDRAQQQKQDVDQWLAEDPDILSQVHHLLATKRLQRSQEAAGGGTDLPLPASCNKMSLISKYRLEQILVALEPTLVDKAPMMGKVALSHLLSFAVAVVPGCAGPTKQWNEFLDVMQRIHVAAGHRLHDF